MVIFFEIIKAIFFGLTILVWVFYLRWKYLWLADGQTQQLQQLLMPWYMVFCGIMLGYMIAHVWAWTLQNEEDKKKIYIKSFIIGIGLWLCLALVYIFV